MVHVRQLDGLRGAAILVVMLFHSNFLTGGWIGVDIFFVLSGFLITALLVQEFDAAGSMSLRHFYMRRILRLGPALVAMLLVFCLVTFLFAGEKRAQYNYTDAAISLLYLSNWARALSMHPPDYLGHTWSLSMEEQFYILWPAMLLAPLRYAKNRKQVVAAALVIALLAWLLRIDLTALGVKINRMYNGLDTRADTLMTGCALGVVVASGLIGEQVKPVLQKVLVFAAPAAAAGLTAFAIFANWKSLSMYYLGFLVIALLAAVLILDALLNPQSLVGKVLGMRWLVWVGSISYGLYLWHYPIYRTLFALGFDRVVVVTAGSLLTFIAAAVSWYLLERPLLKLKKRFAGKRAQEGRTPALPDSTASQETIA